ncbi:HesA/MoeB/ThiF family protein [Desulfosarcina ovata]|uniref:Thiazole biosynthesis protein ThiF n=1 Tax=Desulfosarcina ovata subsp. ovata TaxID=2752305 RepID=A0A5K8A8S6_9BACT|nr:HesA/MoeB/ThiF family protein [Desulfosarcina ovata]BBO88869.1 thiazole biosynthesis protein ThiF [Desulfosarcina ovata subsp. ovata]
MADPLPTRLQSIAENGTLADGTPCRVIQHQAVMILSEQTGTSPRMVELAALQQAILPVRYLRNLKTLTLDDQIQLLRASVCVVGLGGLGGLVTETLTRMGIGRLHLIDGDTFEAHNLNRQLLSDTVGLGQPKSKAAALRVNAINPGTEVTITPSRLMADNADRLVDGCHVVVDCLDNIESRFVLETAARRVGIPMVSAAIAGLTGHVTTIFPEDKGLENIYGPRERIDRSHGAEMELGCLAPGVNLIASIECTEVLKVLLGRENPLRNRLLVVDLNDYTIEALQLG